MTEIGWEGAIGCVLPLTYDQAVTLYRKAWLFMGWTMLAFVTSPLWLFWPFVCWGPIGALPGMALWLAHGAAALWLFRCPECGTSPFTTRLGFMRISHPWPRRRNAAKTSPRIRSASGWLAAVPSHAAISPVA
jgi:hypothetical protein